MAKKFKWKEAVKFTDLLDKQRPDNQHWVFFYVNKERMMIQRQFDSVIWRSGYAWAISDNGTPEQPVRLEDIAHIFEAKA